MSDTPKTRAETVKDNFDAALAQYGKENYMKIFLAVLEDLTVSLGMIADNTSTSATNTETLVTSAATIATNTTPASAES